MNTQAPFVGIDISKDRLDVAVRPLGTAESYPYTDQGIDRLIQALASLKPQLIVLEATGGYETGVIAALVHARLPVVLINPRQSREFAKATGKLAKTDRIDAMVLAHFGEAVRPEPRPLGDSGHRDLSALMSRRMQLIEMVGMEENRLHTTNKAVRPGIESHIEWLKSQVKKIDDDLNQFIINNPALKRKVDIVQSAPGVGPVVSKALLSYLPELGRVNGKEICALAGVAPFNSDSGRRKGKRRVWGGRRSARAALYMGALVATRFNPVIGPFYQRLLEAGKPKKLALTACMRKLLTMVNAMVRDEKAWEVKTA